MNQSCPEIDGSQITLSCSSSVTMRKSLMQFEPYYPTTAKAIYFETIDAVHNALKERFKQPSFIIFSNVEQFLMKTIKSWNYSSSIYSSMIKSTNGESYQKVYDDFVSVYADDAETATVTSELLILYTMFETLEPVHFGDIVEKLKTISPQESVIINNVITIIKIVLTTGLFERSFLS